MGTFFINNMIYFLADINVLKIKMMCLPLHVTLSFCVSHIPDTTSLGVFVGH